MPIPLRRTFELLFYVLCGVGAVLALTGEWLSMPNVRGIGMVTLIAGAAAFGLDMIVTRRAEISTPGSDSVNPSFHVFRGWAAVAWGIAFAICAGIIGGFAVVELTGWSAPKDFFRESPGILVALAGTGLVAYGIGSAGRATYRYRDDERPASRLESRIHGVLAAVFGSCVAALGIFSYLAPARFAAMKASAFEWVISFVPR